jgi:hypothetical protein
VWEERADECASFIADWVAAGTALRRHVGRCRDVKLVDRGVDLLRGTGALTG